MITAVGQDRSRVRAWVERLTLFRAIRTIVVIAAVLVVVAGVLVRILEPHTFTSIGLSFWWAVTTVTTVGYGDIVPTNTSTRLVGAALMLAGVSLIPLVTSVTVSILVAKNQQQMRVEQDARLAAIEEHLRQLAAASSPAAPPSGPGGAPPPHPGPS
jgi:voltage-gated potassium channel